MCKERDPKTREILQRKLTGFRASNDVDIVTRNVDGAGALVAHFLTSQANSLRGVSFHVDYRAERETELIGKAVADAARKARLIADGASMRLGPLVELDLSPESGGVADLPALKPAFEPGPRTLVIPIEPGVQRLSAHLKGTWRLLEN